MTRTNKSVLEEKLAEANKLSDEVISKRKDVAKRLTEKKEELEATNERIKEAYSVLDLEKYSSEREKANKLRIEIEMLNANKKNCSPSIPCEEAVTLTEDLIEYLEGYENEEVMAWKADYEALLKKVESFNELSSRVLNTIEDFETVSDHFSTSRVSGKTNATLAMYARLNNPARRLKNNPFDVK